MPLVGGSEAVPVLEGSGLLAALLHATATKVHWERADEREAKAMA